MEEVNTANKRLKLALDNHERDLKDQIAKLDNIESKPNERMEELNKKKQQTAKAYGIINISGDDLIEINAGGKVIVSKRSTLTQLNDTRLEALFSGRWDTKLMRDSQGRIFLDVNPNCFQAIVDYLTELLISSEDNPPEQPSVDDEHEHIMKHQIELFGLHMGLPGSDIVKDMRHHILIHSWLKEDDSDGEIRLLYRGSRDGLDAKHFHSKCDNQGPTLTIIETTDGYLLGGYSNVSWKSTESDWCRADKAFLFVLPRDEVLEPLKMMLNGRNNGNAVCHYSSFGPAFGSGCDLKVDGTKLTTWFGFTFDASDLPRQLVHRSSERAGVQEFQIKEIEVFEVSSDESKVIENQAEENPEDSNPINMDDINTAIIIKRQSLLRLESGIQQLEKSFKDEQSFITTFTSGETKDIVTLNVNGTIMATKRATLCTAEESVLAQQSGMQQASCKGVDSR